MCKMTVKVANIVTYNIPAFSIEITVFNVIHPFNVNKKENYWVPVIGYY